MSIVLLLGWPVGDQEQDFILNVDQASCLSAPLQQLTRDRVGNLNPKSRALIGLTINSNEALHHAHQ